MKLLKLMIVAVFIGFSTLAAANLIANGDFETGDFTGWTLGGDTAENHVWNAAMANAILAYQGGPFSGTYSAYVGPLNIGTMSQAVSTVIGQTYVFSFALANLDCQPGLCIAGSNSFEALLDGSPVLSEVGAPSSLFTEHTFQFVATGTTTTIEFDYSNLPAYFGIDNVSIEAVPEPASLALLAFGLAGLSVRRRKRPS